MRFTLSPEVASIAAGFDGREPFRAGLKEMRSELARSWKFFQAAKVRTVLNFLRLFEEAYQRAVQKAGEAAIERGIHIAEAGDFFKWFLEWLQNGGWEFILDIIIGGGRGASVEAVATAGGVANASAFSAPDPSRPGCDFESGFGVEVGIGAIVRHVVREELQRAHGSKPEILPEGDPR